MAAARAWAGLGWVDGASRRVVLPGAPSAGPAPRSALLLEVAECAERRVAIVRSPLLDTEERAAVRAALRGVVAEVGFLLASEGLAFALDPDADIVACSEALVALRDPLRNESVVASNVVQTGYVGPGSHDVRVVTRAREPLEAAYLAAGSAALVRADIDRLMVYNDWLGSLAGDVLIMRVIGMACEVAEAAMPREVFVSAHRREVLLVARSDTSSGAAILGEAMVEAMRRARIQLRHPEVRHVPYMTLSAGAVWVPDVHRVPLLDALREADETVAQAKLAGRDRVGSTRKTA